MSSERTKRRRIREEVDFILYETESYTNSNSYFENKSTSDSVAELVLTEGAVQLPANTSEKYSNRNEKNTDSLETSDETLSIHNDINNYYHDEQLPILHTDLCSEIKCKLAEWAVNFNIPQNAVNGLLPIFKSIPGLAEIPKDARTILNIRAMDSTESIHAVDPGFYHHFGLGLALKQHFKYSPIDNIEVIKVVIGIDGLPLAKSSSSQLWPILG